MTKQDILAVIERETGHEATEEMPLEALGADSLELLSLFTALDIPDSVIPDLHTAGDVVRYVESHQ